MKTSDKWLAKIPTFSSSLFAHGPGGEEFFRIGGVGMLGFFRDFSGFHMDWSVLFRLEMYSVKLSLRNLCRAALSLWLALL